MYNDSLVDEIMDTAIEWSINARKFIMPAMEMIENYVSENNLLIIRNNIEKSLFDGDITIEDFKFEIYTDRLNVVANDIIKNLSNLGYENCVYEIYLPNYEIRIHIKNYKQLFVLYNNLYPNYYNPNDPKSKSINDIFPTISIDGIFTDNKILSFSYGIYMISLVQKLYNPEFIDEWDNIIINCKKIYELFSEEKTVTKIDGGGNDHFDKLENIKKMIKRKYRLGDSDLGTLIYIGTYMSKIELIGNCEISTESTFVRSLYANIKKLYSDSKVIFKINYPKIPGDFRLRRFTFYLLINDQKYAFLDVFNSCQYELIPIRRKTDKEGYVYCAANPIVKLKFRLIDYVGLNLLNLNEKSFNHNKQNLLNKINKYTKFIFDKSFNINIEQKPEIYLGNIYDQVIYKKQQMLILKQLSK